MFILQLFIMVKKRVDIPTLSTWCKFAPGRFVAKSHLSTWCEFAPGRIVLVPTVCRIDGERKKS
jgi:hypothetical protein